MHKHRYKFWGWGSVHTLENWFDRTWKPVYLFHCNCGDIQQVDPADFWRTP